MALWASEWLTDGKTDGRITALSNADILVAGGIKLGYIRLLTNYTNLTYGIQQSADLRHARVNSA